MYVAIIGASSESIHAISKAKQLGLSVVALDGNPNAEGLKHATNGCVVDIRTAEFIFKELDKFKPKAVIPIPIGRYLTSIGAVNDYYGFNGVTEKAAILCTDKHLFHKTLYNQGLRDCEHHLIPNGSTDIHNLTMPMKFPIIAKPRYGSGNRAVQIYKDTTELNEQFSYKLPYDEDFVLESYVEGIEYGVDAAIINSELHIILLREKILTPHPFCQCVGYYSVTDENAELYKNVETTIGAAAKSLDLQYCLLHADIVAINGKFFIIEMSARPAGHYLHDIFTPMATGVDTVFEYIKCSLPEINQSYSFLPSYRKNLLIRYFDLPIGRVSIIPEKDYLMKEYPILAYECNLEKGLILEQTRDGHSIMGRGYFIVGGKDRGDLQCVSDEILKQFTVN